MNIKKLNYYTELLELLFKNTSGIWGTNIFVPLGLTYLLKDYLDLFYILIFLFTHFALGFTRFFLGKKALMLIEKKEDVLIYLKYYLFILFLTSILFGLVSIFSVFYMEEKHVFIMLAIVFGLSAGSFLTLSAIYHAIVVFTVPFVSIFIFALLYSEVTLYYLVALILFIYLLVSLPSAYRIYLLLKTNIEKAQIISKQKEEIISKQAQLINSAKMASMGEMIGNIAHQWRQPLSSISSIASSIKLTQSVGIKQEGKELEDNMGTILSKTEYLSSTIETFRDFLKEDKTHSEISIKEEIDLVLKIVQSSLKDNHIQVIYNKPENDRTLITMVKGELDQVIINTINNAKDALIENNIEEPWIKIDLEKHEKKLLLSIEDNAGGIKEEIIEKIFEPYFSTKHSSQGTGLGLHMSYRIINESLKGDFYVKNTKYGAKFFIEIPMV